MDKYLPRLFCNAVRKLYPQFGYKQSDLYISSFPKSGRNWIHFLLANTFIQYSSNEDGVNFHNISEWIPHDYPRRPKVEGLDIPRIVAKHRKYNGQKTKVLYIMRNPVEVMVSYYFYLKGRQGKEIESVSKLIRSKKYGIEEWTSHVRSWENEWDMLVRYEDLKDDTLGQLKKMVKLLEISDSVHEKNLKSAVKKSSFENMKKVEERWGLPNKEGKRSDFKFMKSGRTKRGKRRLDNEDYNYMRSVAGQIANKYGYEIK